MIVQRVGMLLTIQWLMIWTLKELQRRDKKSEVHKASLISPVSHGDFQPSLKHSEYSHWQKKTRMFFPAKKTPNKSELVCKENAQGRKSLWIIIWRSQEEYHSSCQCEYYEWYHFTYLVFKFSSGTSGGVLKGEFSIPSTQFRLDWSFIAAV